jgi:ribosomal protein S18 acetylase RimI-like enzyme
MGYGEALLRAAIALEQERTGIRRLVLQSTEAGYSLYRRLGFREVARFSVYLTK